MFNRSIFCLCATRSRAENIVARLQASGFSEDDLSVLFPADAGALIGLGVPGIEARRFEGKLRDGNILISVHTSEPEDLDLAREIFRSGGGHDICTTSEASPPSEKKQARRLERAFAHSGN